MSNPYETLGVSKSSSDGEIKSAYRNLAKKHHPDQNRGDDTAEQKFKEINAAYDVLKDPQKKAAYDQFGDAAFQGGGGAGGFGGGGFSNTSDAFGDIFSDIFGAMGGGGGGRASQQQRGEDVRYDMHITLEEAFEGGKRTIEVPSMVSCDDCDGSGSADKSAPVSCQACNGRGTVRAQQGFFVVERPCGSCHGQGSTIASPCRTCSGEGRKRKTKTLAVAIPEGVEDGMRIRLSGEGQAGQRGMPAGDLYLFISIAPHTIYERDEMDLHVVVPIPFTVCALGGHVDIPTLDGKKTKLSIPTGTQAGQKLRLKGKGMPFVNRKTKRGDIYVHIQPETPVSLDKEQKKQLEALAKTMPEKAYPASKTFAQK